MHLSHQVLFEKERCENVMEKVKVNKDPEKKSLTIERVFDAPKEKLWRGYSNKEQFEKWWGPEGWETTAVEFEFKPGGKIHYCMKCVDENQVEWFGQEACGIMYIQKIDEPSSFSADDYFSDTEGNINEQMPPQKFEVEFIEEDGKTRFVNRSFLETTEQLEELVKMGMVEGFTSQLSKLEKVLNS
jgi:uncharacterized protein YndB with AHSA1/START domain